jgi:hypothetical protein
MSSVVIYNGTVGPISGSTPFGFYDNDPIFQSEGPKVAKFIASRLGYPLVDVELQSGSMYTCFEEAVTVYGKELYLWKIRENYLSLEGGSTGSVLNNEIVNPNLGSLIRLAENYGTEAGTGGNVTYHKGSLTVIENQQTYDLNAWAQASASLAPGDSIEIKKLFYQGPPALVRFYDPYAGTGAGSQGLLEAFGFGSFSPGINSMMMPLHFDVAKIQAIEMNDQVRKSAYTFELINNQLKIFPIPSRSGNYYFEYIKKSDRNATINPATSGSGGTLITNIGNVPYQNPTYAFINAVGKQWIYEYALSLAKEQLAYIRGKYSTIPIPGSETTLNQADLLADARTEKEALLLQLREVLGAVSRTQQIKNKNEETDALRNTLTNVPLLIYCG